MYLLLLKAEKFPLGVKVEHVEIFWIPLGVEDELLHIIKEADLMTRGNVLVLIFVFGTDLLDLLLVDPLCLLLGLDQATISDLLDLILTHSVFVKHVLLEGCHI